MACVMAGYHPNCERVPGSSLKCKTNWSPLEPSGSPLSKSMRQIVSHCCMVSRSCMSHSWKTRFSCHHFASKWVETLHLVFSPYVQVPRTTKKSASCSCFFVSPKFTRWTHEGGRCSQPKIHGHCSWWTSVGSCHGPQLDCIGSAGIWLRWKDPNDPIDWYWLCFDFTRRHLPGEHPASASCNGRVAPNGFSGRGIHDLGLHPVASIARLPWRAGGFHGHKLPMLPQYKRAKPGSPSSNCARVSLDGRPRHALRTAGWGTPQSGSNRFHKNFIGP